jgi:hypothetical protein
MTELLKRAFDEASKLPDEEQDALASALLEELQGERQWDAILARSQEQLSSLADDALAEHRAGRTTTLDPEGL